jgi:tetratricopeptide (TPR) repeat protein
MNYVVSADATATYNKGVQQAQDGNYKRAQQLFQQAVRKDPKHVGALSYLGMVFANTRQYSPAIKMAKRALKLDPTNEQANQTLVRIYEIRGSWKKMVAPLNALTQNYGSESRYYAKLGEAHFRLKHYMSSAPSRTVKYYNMGLVYGFLKRHDEAIRYFELALNEKPGLAGAYYNIGAMYQNSEQLESAMENYEKALRIDPNIEMASSNLDYLKGYLERRKQQQGAAGEMTFEQTPPFR